jgi:uncharacterized protein
MNATHFIRLASVAAIGWQLLVAPALAQSTPAAIAAAREVVELKGGVQMFDPIIVGVVEQTKVALLQTNPQLSRDLDAVSAQLRNDLAPRRDELVAEAAKFYAARFTEQELKEIVAFLKTPAGRKMVAQEPLALDDTFNYVQQWASRLGEDVMNRFRAEMKKKGHNL